MTKSKERISKYGEVFTSKNEVKAMLNLVKHETKRIDSRFFEPACGDGNFLVEVLYSKLQIVKERYSNIQTDFEKYAFIAASSIYGVDILEDNVNECRRRLYLKIEQLYLYCFKETNENFLKSIKYVLSKNILYGNALTLKNPDIDKPIVFAEWCFTRGNKVKRTDYTLANLLAYQPFEEDTLFSDLGEKAFIPIALDKYPEINFMNVCNAYNT